MAVSPADHLEFLKDLNNKLDYGFGAKPSGEPTPDDLALQLLKTEDPLPHSVPREVRLAEDNAAASQEVTVTFYLSGDGNTGHIRIEQYEAFGTVFAFDGVTFPRDWVGVSKGRLRLRALPTGKTYYKGTNRAFFPLPFWRVWRYGEVLILRLYLGTENNPYETVIGWYVGSAITRSCYGSGTFVAKK